MMEPSPEDAVIHQWLGGSDHRQGGALFFCRRKREGGEAGRGTHTPYTLYPEPYTLNPTPYNLHFIPHTCTLHPTRSVTIRARVGAHTWPLCRRMHDTRVDLGR